MLVRTGCATETSTVRTSRMRRAVKCPSVSHQSFPVAMTHQCASRQSESVTVGETVRTTPTRDPTVVSQGMWVLS